MAKDLSRAEVGRVIDARTEGVVLGTAMLFLAAGSLWAHFGLGPVFFEPPFLLSWALIHGGSFVVLFLKRFERVMPLAGLMGMQLHLHSSVESYSLPFFPMAPIFFLVATLSLTAFPWGRARSALAFWAMGWAGSVFWLAPLQGADPRARIALFTGMALNLFFVATFLLMMRYFSRRMGALVESLGPKQRFDAQRIHASRLQALGELAGGLSHEIQNPLLAINGYSYQIQEDIKSPGEGTLELVGKANLRIKHNVDRIIEIARVMKGFVRNTATDEFTAISFREVIDDTLVLMKHNLKASGVEFRVDLPEKDAVVRGNAVEMSQVLVNLLSNARDACLDSDRKKVTLGYAVEAESLRVWVEDTGPGISEELRADVYRAFFTTKPAGVGTGLGLYIAGIISERHGAQLEFSCPRDAAGRVLGTRFEWQVPLHREAAQAKGDAA